MLFSEATAVQADTTDSSDARSGRYRSTIQPGWDINGNANGGYLIAIAARAMTQAAGRPNPVTLTAHYLSPGKPGPVTIDTTMVKEGKSFATVTASMYSADKPILQLLGSFSDLAPRGDNLLTDGAPPELPPVEACLQRELESEAGFAPAFHRQVDLRLHPEDAEFRNGNKSGKALVRGWFRLREGEPIDTIALLQASDAFPPTIFNTDMPVAWVPTLELTVHVRRNPAPGWLRCAFTTRFVSDGMLEEDSQMWDSSGRLVALSRQLALVPRPPSE